MFDIFSKFSDPVPFVARMLLAIERSKVFTALNLFAKRKLKFW